MGWKTVYCSVPGTSHKDRNINCQDYVDLYQVGNNIIIGAVADGAGSAKHSEHGSKSSVETTIFYFNQWRKQLNPKTKPTEQEAREFCAEILQEVKYTLTDKAEELGCSEEDLASTLLAFFTTPNWTLFMQIGDGFIVSKSKNSDYFNLVFPPNKGEYINETTFVTSTDALGKLDVTVIDETQEFICASTDGLERLAIDFSSGEAHPPFFNPFYLGIKEYGVSDGDKKDLEDWLNSPDVNARTDDDKTLLLCFNELCN
jgi:Protein phosphatase 2C